MIVSLDVSFILFAGYIFVTRKQEGVRVVRVEKENSEIKEFREIRDDSIE